MKKKGLLPSTHSGQPFCQALWCLQCWRVHWVQGIRDLLEYRLMLLPPPWLLLVLLVELLLVQQDFQLLLTSYYQALQQYKWNVSHIGGNFQILYWKGRSISGSISTCKKRCISMCGQLSVVLNEHGSCSDHLTAFFF